MSSEKPFISIKVNGSDLYELNLEDLKKLQDEKQNYKHDIKATAHRARMSSIQIEERHR